MTLLLYNCGLQKWQIIYVTNRTLLRKKQYSKGLIHVQYVNEVCWKKVVK